MSSVLTRHVRVELEQPFRLLALLVVVPFMLLMGTTSAVA